MGAAYQILTMSDGQKVRVGTFCPEELPKGVIQIFHGFGEYSGHYSDFIDFFVNHGYICVIHDQRGHGPIALEFPKSQGISKNYQKFLEDGLEIRHFISFHFPNLPVFLMGHSMGGNIALNLLLNSPSHQMLYQKAIIESPWLELAKPPAKIIQSMAKIIGSLSPKIRVHTKINVAGIAHDATVVKKMTEDGIYHDFLSLRLFSQIKKAGEFAQKNASKLTIPTLLFCAEKDQICSAKAIRSFCKKGGTNIKLIEVADGYHELHLDTKASQTLEQMLSFLSLSEDEKE